MGEHSEQKVNSSQDTKALKMLKKQLKVLFFGDLVGKVGRNSVKSYLADLKKTED